MSLSVGGGAVPLLPAQANAVTPGGPHSGPMRLGVIDVGSNTVHLLVVDAHRGGQPDPAASVKVPLRLVELLDADGSLSEAGEQTLTECISDMRRHAESLDVFDLVAFATSALRDATNSDEVLARLRAATGVALRGAARRGRGAADLPRRPPLVRLERRAAALPGHRRRLARDRLRDARGAGRRRCRCRSAPAG